MGQHAADEVEAHPAHTAAPLGVEQQVSAGAGRVGGAPEAAMDVRATASLIQEWLGGKRGESAVPEGHAAHGLAYQQRVICSAQGLGVEHRTLRTREVERDAYARNDALRCFHCKAELYSVMSRLADAARTGSFVLSGANADDARDLRPGLRAGELKGVHSPLLEQGLGKDSVRAIARLLDLPVAEKPALACLSSRVAYGIRITPDLLSRIDRAEQAVRAMGFDQVRVRHLGDEAVIEVEAEEVPRLSDHPKLGSLERFLKQLGWRQVGIDPAGYRSGSINRTLARPTQSGGAPDTVPEWTRR